jgi:hypothetical protein
VTPEVVGQKQSEVFYSAFKNGSPHYSITTLFFSLVRLGQNHPEPHDRKLDFLTLLGYRIAIFLKRFHFKKERTNLLNHG